MSNKASIDPQKFLELEYQQVSAGILKRIELRQQPMQIALILAGVLIGAGVQSQNMLISSIYPPLAFCFAMLWAQNDIRGRLLGQYLKEEIAGDMSRWESFFKERRITEAILGRYHLSIFAPGGALIISELIATIFPVFYATNSLREQWILITLDFLALLGTVLLIGKVAGNRERVLTSKTAN